MASSRFLLKPWFWILFIVFVIISLYLYGLKILGDRTELAQTKIMLEERNQQLSNCTSESNLKTIKIAELNGTISQQKKTILEQETSISEQQLSISELQNSISELENRPPKVVTKYQDRTVYKDKPEPYHKYGKNNCNLLIYTTCSTGYIKVKINGDNMGQLTGYYSSAPDCNSTDQTISKILVAGKHHIQAENTSTKSTWDFYITILEDDCYRQGLTCK